MKIAQQLGIIFCVIVCLHHLSAAASSTAMPPIAHMAQKAFFMAVCTGDYETVQALHKAGIDVNSVDNNGKTALSRLILIDKKKFIDKHLEVADYLLKNSATVSALDIAHAIPSQYQTFTMTQQSRQLLVILKQHSSLRTQMLGVGLDIGMVLGVAGVLFGYPFLGLKMLGRSSTTRQDRIVWGVWLSGAAIGLTLAVKKLRSTQEIDPHFPAQ